ncbi:MAG: amidohydrolase [Saprospiraceae bacterium]|nr:amidohydrolase [Saprospiraceae bacterium]MCF8249424.1 amidohydrolase [Saprospiraceae bacterium]MCF8279078.1 amidohydrolase [Bacteroidales bacterium]MCF8311553.1 amidohydrolase [Saprospiraceae bacterium]MCF8440043.1 amidohydrolase [Saprospiraceae bacterium]
MANILRITTVQSALAWEDTTANLTTFTKKLSGLAGTTDLVVLPEMFTTGFSMDAPRLAEPMNGRTMAWLSEQARLTGAVITGSFIAKEGVHYFNRLVWMRPDGSFDLYDKRHLFSPAAEHETYTAGHQKLVTEWLGWEICPLICYDLRFPVWSRNVEGYDLLLYVANWPDRRSHHWKSLLTARAIENQCYVAGVNRCGSDGVGFHYAGDTSVIDYSGKILHQVSDEEDISTLSLSMEMLLDYRRSLQFLEDKDKFEIF